MTLPTTNPLNSTDDDSDMFGPPRSSPVRLHQRPRVPMISAKLRQREERKRILQLCARKLERIKDSETNLRRSVCINNTYSRLTDEVRREKQSRYLANLPKSDFKLEKDESSDSYHMQTHSHFGNVVVSSYSSSSASASGGLSAELRDDGHLLQIDHYHHQQHHNPHHPLGAKCLIDIKDSTSSKLTCSTSSSSLMQHQHQHQHQHHQLSIDGGTLDGVGVTTNATAHIGISTHRHQNNSNSNSNSHSTSNTNLLPNKKKRSSSCCVDTDLETLDRELSAINASMPLIDPEITQGAEQLEKAISSRKRARTEDENDRLVREALSQFYLPTQRLISAIDDCPLDIKRTKSCHHHHHNHHHHHHHSLLHHTSTLHQNPQNNLHCGGSLGVGMVGLSGTSDLDLDLGLDLNQNHKEFEVIMDALRLGTTTTVPQTVVPSTVVDSCGQAAMMSESGVFHNLVVTSLET